MRFFGPIALINLLSGRLTSYRQTTTVLWLRSWSSWCPSILFRQLVWWQSWSVYHEYTNDSAWKTVLLRPICKTQFTWQIPHIPFSGRNPKLNQVLGNRPKILVLNKMDLADSSKTEVEFVWVFSLCYAHTLVIVYSTLESDTSNG